MLNSLRTGTISLHVKQIGLVFISMKKYRFITSIQIGFWLSYWALEERGSALFMGYEPISLYLAYFSMLILRVTS
jgi:hypothetical protein